MSQNLAQSNSAAIEIPHGWQPPKFQLGQPVIVRVPCGSGQYEIEFGVIAGFTYHGANTAPTKDVDFAWEYNVALSPESPGWKFYGGIYLAEEDDFFPAGVTDPAHPPVMTALDKGYELVLR
jgi:hypothetical protein